MNLNCSCQFRVIIYNNPLGVIVIKPIVSSYLVATRCLQWRNHKIQHLFYVFAKNDLHWPWLIY